MVKKNLNFFLIKLLTVAVIQSYARGNQLCNRTVDELIQWIKNDGYDNTIRPNATGAPVAVSVEAFILSIGSVNEKTMDFSLDMYFRQRWKEDRLCYLPQANKIPEHRINVHTNLIPKLWKPDIFFKNSKVAKFHHVPSDNMFLAVSPTGDVLFSSRITTTLSCQMDFRRFPMDIQRCDFHIGSYSSTEDDVIVRWRNDGLIISKDVEISQYSITEVTNKNLQGVYNTGVFSEPKATVVLQRRLMYYVYSYYLPAGLVCFLSWISFWIDPRSVPARVSLGVITILAMGGFLHPNSGPADVSYATALDVYIISCYVFVFATLLEFSFVHYGISYVEKYQDEKEAEKEQAFKIESLHAHTNKDEQAAATENGTAQPPTNDTTSHPVQIRPKWKTGRLFRIKDNYMRFSATSLETYSRAVFPVIFIVFNVFYWMFLYPPK